MSISSSIKLQTLAWHGIILLISTSCFRLMPMYLWRKWLPTYAPELCELLMRPGPLGMCVISRGELGADRRLEISGSTSDSDPCLFFFLANALLNELRNCEKKKIKIWNLLTKIITTMNSLIILSYCKCYMYLDQVILAIEQFDNFF